MITYQLHLLRVNTVFKSPWEKVCRVPRHLRTIVLQDITVRQLSSQGQILKTEKNNFVRLVKKHKIPYLIPVEWWLYFAEKMSATGKQKRSRLSHDMVDTKNTTISSIKYHRFTNNSSGVNTSPVTGFKPKRFRNGTIFLRQKNNKHSIRYYFSRQHWLN